MAVSVGLAVSEIFSVNNGVTLKTGLGFVQGNSTIWRIAYEFLLAFHSNYGTISYRLRNIAAYWSKIAIFYTQP